MKINKAFLLSPIALAVLTMMGEAAAQQPTEPPKPAETAKKDEPKKADAKKTETVMVTGFRASLESALNDKREDNGIVDVIKAEDIAKFPDTNLAESLQRISGRRRSTATPAKAARSPCAAWAATSPASASTASRRWPPPAAPTARAAPTAAAASTSTSSPPSCSASSRCARARRPRSTKARSAPPSTCRPRARSTMSGFTAGDRGQMGYNDLSEECDPRGAFLLSQHLRRRQVRRARSRSPTRKRHLLEEGFSTVRWDNGPSSGGFCAPVGVTPAQPDQLDGDHLRPAPRQGVPRACPNTPANIAAYNAASNAEQLPSAPAALRPPDPRAGAPRRHRRAQCAARATARCSPSTCSTPSSRPPARRTSSRRSRSAAPPRRAASRRPACVAGRIRRQRRPALRRVQRRRHPLRVALRRARAPSSRSPAHRRARAHATGCASPAWSAARSRSSATRSRPRPRSMRSTSTATRSTSATDAACRPSPIRSTSTSAGGAADASSACRAASGTQPATIPTPPSSEIRIRPQGADNTLTTCPRRPGLGRRARPLTLKGGARLQEVRFRARSSSAASTRTTRSSRRRPAPSLASLTTTLTGFGRGLGLPAGTPTALGDPEPQRDRRGLQHLLQLPAVRPRRRPGRLHPVVDHQRQCARQQPRGHARRTPAASSMADFRTELFGLPLRGNVGVRYVKTEHAAPPATRRRRRHAVTVDNELRRLAAVG